MQLTPDIRTWLMAELRFPVLATISSSGMPSQSVMWFDIDPDRDDTIVMNTRVGRRKERHLRRDNRASLIFPDGYFSRTFVGTVEIDDDRERSLADIKALARRYGSDPERFNGQERVTLRLRVARTHSQHSVAAIPRRGAQHGVATGGRATSNGDTETAATGSAA